MFELEGKHHDNIPASQPASQPASLIFARIAAAILPARFIAKPRRVASFHCIETIFAI